ncbi:MAG: hypothetical protein M3362_03160 [Acidobacteriota bacterium]|nr:hypothetical protein [Acidobacteriota bacterium]
MGLCLSRLTAIRVRYTRVACRFLWPSPSSSSTNQVTLAAGFYPDDHFAREAGVEAADAIPFMLQFAEVERTVSRVTVANSLLTRVKVHTTINSHGHLLRGLMRKLSLPQLERSSRRCLLHHITT